MQQILIITINPRPLVERSVFNLRRKTKIRKQGAGFIQETQENPKNPVGFSKTQPNPKKLTMIMLMIFIIIN